MDAQEHSASIRTTCPAAESMLFPSMLDQTRALSSAHMHNPEMVKVEFMES